MSEDAKMETGKPSRWNVKLPSYAAFLMILIGVPVLVMLIYPFTPAGIQSRNLRVAREHAPTIEKALREEKRFSEVRVGGFTGDGGMIGVWGWVATEADLNALKERLLKMKLPLEAKVMVRAYEDGVKGDS